MSQHRCSLVPCFRDLAMATHDAGARVVLASRYTDVVHVM